MKKKLTEKQKAALDRGRKNWNNKQKREKRKKVKNAPATTKKNSDKRI